MRNVVPISIALCLCACGALAASPRVGELAPDLPADGWMKDAPESLKVEDFRGDVLLLTHF